MVEKPSFTMGRTQDSDLPIVEPSVSRVHLAIEIKDQQIWVTDKHSANGTFVNDRRLESGQTLIVLPNDVIKLGTNLEEFRFLAFPRPFEMLGTEKKKEELLSSMESVARQFETKSRERVEKELRQARAEADQVLAQAKKEAEILRTSSLVESQQRKATLESEFAKGRQEAQVLSAEERLKARREADMMIADSQKRIQADYDENAQRIEAELREAHERALEVLTSAETKARIAMEEARDEAAKVRLDASEEARRIQQETNRKSAETLAGVKERVQREVAEKKTELIALARIEAEQERENVIKDFAAQREQLHQQVAGVRKQFDTIDGEFKDKHLKLQAQLDAAEAHAKKERERLAKEIADQKSTLDEQVEIARTRAEREREKVMKELASKRTEVEADLSKQETTLDALKSEIQSLTRDKNKVANEIEKMSADVTDAKALIASVKDLEERREVADRQFKEFTANRTEGLSKLERELREERERGLAEYQTLKKSQEAEVAKERLKAMEAVQKFITTEEQKYEQAKKLRAVELTEGIHDALVPKLEAWIKDPASAASAMKPEIAAIVTDKLLSNASSITASMPGVEPVVSQEVRDRRVKKGMVWAGVAAAVALYFFGKPLLTQMEDAQKNSYAAQEMEKRRIQSVYNPEQTEDFRGSYTDNVLYMKGYFETKTDPDYVEKWTLKLNDLNLLRPLELSEEDVIKFIAKETNLVQRLGTLKKSIDAVYLKEGLERMRTAEDEDTLEMAHALKGEDNFKKIRALEKDFLKEYRASHKTP